MTLHLEILPLLALILVAPRLLNDIVAAGPVSGSPFFWSLEPPRLG